MVAPERFAETSDSPLAPRAPSIHGAQNFDAIGSTTDIDWPLAPIASEAYDPG
jgi:hypothetical protein